MRHAALQGLLLGQNLVTLTICIMPAYLNYTTHCMLRDCIMHLSMTLVCHTMIAL